MLLNGLYLFYSIKDFDFVMLTFDTKDPVKLFLSLDKNVFEYFSLEPEPG